MADPDDALPVALVDDGVTVERIEASSPDERARALVDATTGGVVVWVGSPDGDKAAAL